MFPLHGPYMEPPSEPAPDPSVDEVRTVPKFLIMLGLYVGALVVVYGIINFEPPSEVRCAMILSCQ